MWRHQYPMISSIRIIVLFMVSLTWICEIHLVLFFSEMFFDALMPAWSGIRNLARSSSDIALSSSEKYFNSFTPGQHDDVIKWENFPSYWPFVRGIHRSPVTSPHKGQWRVALMFSLICTRINCWVNNGEAGDLRRHRAHYDVTVMKWPPFWHTAISNAFTWMEMI